MISIADPLCLPITLELCSKSLELIAYRALPGARCHCRAARLAPDRP